MKKIKLLFLLSLLTIVFLSLGSNLGVSAKGIDDVNSSDNYKVKHNELIDFIANNLDDLSEEYYKYSGEVFNANSIEYDSIGYIMTKNEYVSYIDFDGNNGYMVISPEYELYEFEVEGDLDYLRNDEIIYYSEYKGLSDHNIDNSSDDELKTIGSNVGDGEIFDADSYMSQKYTEFSFEREYSIENYEHISQSDTTFYCIYDETIGGNVTEGNCVLNSVYSMMNSWQNTGLAPSLPSSSDVIKYDPATMDPKYDEFINAGYFLNPYRIVSKFAKRINGDKALDNVPELYAKIREIIGERGYDYGVDGFYNNMHYTDVNYLISFVAAEYGFFPEISNMGDDLSAMEAYFAVNGRAQLIIVSDSTSYSNHAMACIGFRKYKHESGWWIFSKTEYKYLVEVDDGHSETQYNSGGKVWYDPNGTSGSSETILVYDTMK